jgi:hypothetical protein
MFGLLFCLFENAWLLFLTTGEVNAAVFQHSRQWVISYGSSQQLWALLTYIGL